MFCGVTLLNKTGKRINFETIENEIYTVEAENKVLICLSGSMLEELKPMYAQYEDVWIQGLRKKRRERHFLFFERDSKLKPVPQFYSASSKWFRIGNINYLIGNDHGIATWTAQKGPDSIDRIIDEGLRAFSTNKEDVRISNAIREFYFEWEWKGPIWKETAHDTFWATGYEGDLTSTLEIVWNSPV